MLVYQYTYTQWTARPRAPSASGEVTGYVSVSVSLQGRMLPKKSSCHDDRNSVYLLIFLATDGTRGHTNIRRALRRAPHAAVLLVHPGFMKCGRLFRRFFTVSIVFRFHFQIGSFSSPFLSLRFPQTAAATHTHTAHNTHNTAHAGHTSHHTTAHAPLCLTLLMLTQ